jgi:hypothetical protein
LPTSREPITRHDAAYASKDRQHRFQGDDDVDDSFLHFISHKTPDLLMLIVLQKLELVPGHALTEAHSPLASRRCNNPSDRSTRFFVACSFNTCGIHRSKSFFDRVLFTKWHETIEPRWVSGCPQKNYCKFTVSDSSAKRNGLAFSFADRQTDQFTPRLSLSR